MNAVEGCIEPIRQALREKYGIYNNDSNDEDFAYSDAEKVSWGIMMSSKPRVVNISRSTC